MLEVEKIYAELDKAGDDWADKKAAYDALDRNTKSVLAAHVLAFMDGGVSRVEGETRALASAAYKEHLAQVSLAHKSYLQAQVLWSNLQTLAELRRSEESTRRAEANIR